MRTLTCLLVSATVVTVVGAVSATPAGAQLTSVGIQAGVVESHQVRDRASDSQTRRGILAGVYAEPVTPMGWLSFLVELSYVQQGAKYDLTLPVIQGANGNVTLEAETEYLTFSLAPSVRASLGPFSVFGYAGPSTDLRLRSRSAGTLSPMLAQVSNQVLAVVAGAGVEVRAPGGKTIRFEMRTHRQISAAFSPDAGDIRYHSTEVLVRLGMRPPTP